MIKAKNSNGEYVDIEDIKAENIFKGSLPVTFQGTGENLINYKIYGNTINNESVGEKTANLFNGNLIDGYVQTDGEISKSFTKGEKSSEFIPVSANSKYTLKVYITDMPSEEIEWRAIALYDENKNFIKINAGESTDSITVTTTNDTAYIRISFRTFGCNSYAMLNEGSEILPYEAYGYKLPVKIEGKNLCQFNSINNNIIAKLSKGVNYTFSFTSNINVTINFFKNNSEGNLVTRIRNVIGRNYVNFIADEDFDLFINGFSNESGKSFINNVTDFQLEEGSENTNYEPYHEPIITNLYIPEPLRKVGNEADYIDYKEQKLVKIRKNLLKITATSKTINGITFTVNDDNSITCNGQATTTTFFEINNSVDSIGNILSGCPKNGSNNTYLLRYQKSDSYVEDLGSGKILPNYSNGYIIIRINKNYICDNLTFYPMIRKANIEDDTYEPYIEDNELNVELPALETINGTNILSVDTGILPSNVWGKIGETKDIEYVKDNLGNVLYSKYKEIETEILPTNFISKDNKLKNYRIYGNTENGENVGDLVTDSQSEHYGEYAIPITNNSETANIYLNEPLRKVGDEVEFIDYGEQKQHRVRKNLLKNIVTSQTINGVIFTVNSDKSITCNGTAGASEPSLLYIPFTLPIELYEVSGCPDSGSDDTYRVDIRDNSSVYNYNGNFVIDNGTGCLFDGGNNKRYCIRIAPGYTCDNLTFYPMIRRASFTDDTYEPYIENTEVDISLPEIAVTKDTNTLTVETEVQPSKVYLKGKITEN